ncbi:AbgT family transporter [Salinicoccus sp. HZC-1]|uniref:AbgT family transporter n=1 Tax=Salinicoccus sp. HZC-1 TaxID=3385497 RepID=UPI00398B5374
MGHYGTGLRTDVHVAWHRTGSHSGCLQNRRFINKHHFSPLMPFLPLIVAFAQRYGKENGIGTVVSLMLPYSVIFIIVWTIFFVIWFMMGIPTGPGASISY